MNTPDSFSFIHIPADDQALETARAFALQHAETIQLPPAAVFKLELALEEILVNVVHYAYPEGTIGTVDIGCRADASGISICICDSGRAFNPLEKETPDLNLGIEDRQIGGLGIFLTREMVDDIQYRRENDRNVISFFVRFP